MEAMEAGGRGGGIAVDQKRSWIRITVPFSFDPRSYARSVAALDGLGWQLAERPHPVWQRQELPGESLVPNVARQWDPGRAGASAAFWQVTAQALNSPSGLAAGAPWWIKCRPATIPAQLTRVTLAAFAAGAGSISFELVPRPYAVPGQPDEERWFGSDRVATWLELTRQLRFLSAGRCPEIVVAKTGRGNQAVESVDQLSGFPLAGGALSRPAGTLGDLARALLLPFFHGAIERPSPALVEDVLLAEALDLPSHGFPFLALFLDGGRDDDVRRIVLLARSTARTDRDFGATPEDLRLAGPGYIERAAGAWLYCSLMSAGFVGHDLPASGYFAQFHGELRGVHHLGLVFALHQRQILLRLLEDAGESWLATEAGQRVTSFQQLTDRLHLLTARGAWLHLFRAEGQHRYYEAVQAALSVNELRQELRVTLGELTAAARLHLAEEAQAQQQRFERRVSVFALVFGVPSLVLAFLGVNIDGLTAPDAVSLGTVLALVVLALAAGALVGMAVRGQRRPAGGAIRAAGGGEAPRPTGEPPPSSSA